MAYALRRSLNIVRIKGIIQHEYYANKQYCLLCTNNYRHQKKFLMNEPMPQANDIVKRGISLKELQHHFLNAFYWVDQTSAGKFVKDVFVYTHDATGLPWWTTIILVTTAARVIVLPLGLHQEQITERLSICRKKIQKIAQKLTEETMVASRKLGWSKQKVEFECRRSVSIKTDAEWKKLIEHYNCHPFKHVVILLGNIPLWILLSIKLRTMTASTVIASQLSTEGTLWVQNLTLPDPTMILPIIVTIINLAIIELNLSKGTKSRLNVVMGTFGRAVSVLPLMVGHYVPSSVTLYWTTSVLMALGQNLLFMSPKVRQVLSLSVTNKHPYKFAWSNFKERWRIGSK